MDTTNFLQLMQSRKIAVAIGTLFALALLVSTFSIGMAIGYRKARFSYAWGENYQHNFGGPRGGFMGDFRSDLSGRDFIGAHGTAGQIIGITDQEIVIRGREGRERIVLITGKTEIHRFHNRIGVRDLMIDEPLVVIGEPTGTGQIEARFIRVVPLPTSSL